MFCQNHLAPTAWVGFLSSIRFLAPWRRRPVKNKDCQKQKGRKHERSRSLWRCFSSERGTFCPTVQSFLSRVIFSPLSLAPYSCPLSLHFPLVSSPLSSNFYHVFSQFSLSLSLCFVVSRFIIFIMALIVTWLLLLVPLLIRLNCDTSVDNIWSFSYNFFYYERYDENIVQCYLPMKKSDIKSIVPIVQSCSTLLLQSNKRKSFAVNPFKSMQVNVSNKITDNCSNTTVTVNLNTFIATKYQ